MLIYIVVSMWVCTMPSRAAPAFVRPDTPDQDKLRRVLELAQEQVNLTTEVASLERQLEAAKNQLRDIAHKRLPDAMDEASVDSVGLPDIGYDVKLRPWYDGSLPRLDPKDPTSARRRQAALDWVSANDYGDLVKTTVTILFGRSEHNVAVSTFEAIREYLGAQGLPNIVAMVEDIHHMTYKAFLREQTEAGVVLPLDTLNAVIGRVAKIEERKNK